MFKVLGILVAIYTVYAVIRGDVYSKSGPNGGMVSRKDSPGYFWTMIVIYAVLSVALLFVP